MEIEKWVSIPGYENIYEISNLGNLKSVRRGILMSKSIDVNGYYKADLRFNKKRKSYKIHQLVAMSFLGHTPNGNKVVVDHIDGNKLNNNLTNLRLISQRENIYGVGVSKKKQCLNKFLGVHFYKKTGKWQAQLTINGKKKHLGYYSDENDARDIILSYIKTETRRSEHLVFDLP